jgi:hypothetical protein
VAAAARVTLNRNSAAAREVRSLGQKLPPDLPAGRRGTLIRLVTRLLVAQAAGLGESALGDLRPVGRKLGQA